MEGGRVLLVDDDEDFVEAFSERLRARGLSVDTAGSGVEALERAKARGYDAVILDLAMPELDGLETMRFLLKENPDLQVILLTGHASLQKGIEAMKLGAMDFLEKPANIEKLMEQIAEAKANKLLLTEKRLKKKMSDILRSKGW
ncbi:MAG: response regulator [Deltaproteobacteria bacterium]|nr:response regulator [Deltaproteobacteria bacterium]